MNTGNFTLKALAIACSLALTACGGGGGGGQPSTQSRPTVPSAPSAAKTAADNAIADIAAKAQAVQAALTRNPDTDNDGKISATEAAAANQAINNAKAALQAAIANAETKAQDAALSPAEKTQAAAALTTAKNSTDVRNAQAASANVQPTPAPQPPAPQQPSAAKVAADNAIADIDAKAKAVQAALTRDHDTDKDGKISATEAAAANKAINDAKDALQAAIANAETKAKDAALSPAEKTQADAALTKAKNSENVREAQAASANVKPTTAPAPQPQPQPPQPSAATGFGQDNNGRMKPNAGGVSGGVLSTDAMRQSDESSYGSIQNPEGLSKNEVVLNGVKIATATTGQKRYETEESNNQTAKSIHSSDILPDVRYGAVVDTSSGVMAIRQGLFVQGTAAGADTVAVKTGTVEYNGTGLHFGKPSSNATAGLPFITADPLWSGSAPNTEDLNTSGRATTVKALVNFDRKTIGIDITDPGSRTQGRPNASELAGAPIHFDGVIQGNSFTNAAGQEKTFAGGFYGAAADQLAGMYRLNAQKANESSGVFGAQASNGSNTPAPAPTPSPAPNPTPTPPSIGAVTESTYYKLPDKQQLTDAKLPMAETNQAISNGIQTLVVDGVSIALPAANQGFEKGMYYYAFNNTGNVIAGAAQIMLGGKDQGLLFVQGNLTPQDQIPTGTANYSGKVLHFRERVVRHENGNLIDANNVTYSTQGNFTAQANFANRNLSVTINSGDYSYMRTKVFTANINGNTFSGTGSDRSIEGGFYGANAAAIAGKYQYSDGGTSKFGDSGFGVFSGNKQQ
ncbi:hypothetical protein HpSP79_02920 [Helicobacter pylori]